MIMALLKAGADIKASDKGGYSLEQLEPQGDLVPIYLS